jgi:hypothetical protein
MLFLVSLVGLFILPSDWIQDSRSRIILTRDSPDHRNDSLESGEFAEVMDGNSL